MPKLKRENLVGKMVLCHYCGHRNLITNPKRTTCGMPLKTIKITNQKGKQIGEVVKDDNGRIIRINNKTGCLGIAMLLLAPLVYFMLEIICLV